LRETPADRVKSVHLFGDNMDLYSTDKTFIQVTLARAWNVKRRTKWKSKSSADTRRIVQIKQIVTPPKCGYPLWGEFNWTQSQATLDGNKLWPGQKAKTAGSGSRLRSFRGMG
jgi:hypothetical protein